MFIIIPTWWLYKASLLNNSVKWHVYHIYNYVDIQLEFENQSYTVNDKNNPENPVIRITYPVNVPQKLFPIHVEVETKDDTATGKLLHMYYFC